MYTNICLLLSPNASPLSYWCFGILIIAPLTKSPISAIPQRLNTITAARSPDMSTPITLVLPKNTINKSTSCGIILIISRYTLSTAFSIGFLKVISIPTSMPKGMLIITAIKLILRATPIPPKSLTAFLPLNITLRPKSGITHLPFYIGSKYGNRQ